jgi:phage terminase small subunit
MPGPRPRSVDLRLIQGTKADHPDLNRPVAPDGGYPPPPAWMQPEATEIFHSTLRRLSAIGLNSEVDYDFVVSFTMTTAMMHECERMISKVGIARSKRFATWEKLARRQLAMSKELGLTPASRNSITVPIPTKPAGQELFAS